MRTIAILTGLLLASACGSVVGVVSPVDTGSGAPTDDTDAVVDTDTDTDTDTDPGPRPPIADAGPDVEGFVRQDILVDGSGSYDPDGEALTYRWTLLDGPEGSDVTLADVESPVATLRTRRAGTYTVELTVDDGSEVSEPDTALVEVVVPYIEGEIFDPEEAWLVGTTSQGSCFLDIVADPLSPDSGTVAFPCSRSQQALTDDGRLLYLHQFRGAPRVFRCDGDCTLAPGEVYPRDPRPELNDPSMPHPCDDEEDIVRWFHGVGGVLYQCGIHRRTGLWLDAGAAPVLSLPPGSDPLARDVDGNTLYRERDTSGRVFWLDADTGASVPVGADIEGFVMTALAIRARPEGGFRIAMREPGSWATRVTLFTVDSDGVLTRVGDYPDPPEPVLSRWPGHVLDADGHLWHQGRVSFDNASDVVVRRTFGGEAEVVYTEESDPFVKLHVSDLVTAP